MKKGSGTLVLYTGVFFFFTILISWDIHAQTLAFPTAEGFGKFAQGGRGGKVMEVTTLNCTGPGSFTEAFTDPNPRTIVFKTGGIIDCSNHPDIYMDSPYLTIAGQTAPGDGIVLKGMTMIIVADHVIVQDMQVRLGDTFQGSPDSAGSLAIIGDSKNVMIDHVSASWGSDDTLNIWERTKNVSVQWSIISEGVHCGNKSSCHGKGMLQGSDAGNTISIHHNLFANSPDRNPYLQTGTVDLINNVNHNTGGNATHLQAYWAPLKANLVGNYFSKGPLSTPYDPIRLLGAQQSPKLAGSLAYIEGNIDPIHRPNNNLPELDVVMFTDGLPNFPTTTTRIPTMFYPSETDAFQAYDDVLASAGASRQLNEDGSLSFRRGVIDSRVVNEVRTGTGKMIFNTVREVGGFPQMASGTGYLDSDHDGMSDFWEDMHGLNKFDPSDRNGDFNSDGYTNLEDFLYGLSPVVFPGDFNGDGKVDGADLAQWQGDYGVNGDSDSDHDGDSDGADFLAWQRGFGYGTLSASTVVPEPSTSLLILIGLAICFPQRSTHV